MRVLLRCAAEPALHEVCVGCVTQGHSPRRQRCCSALGASFCYCNAFPLDACTCSYDMFRRACMHIHIHMHTHTELRRMAWCLRLRRRMGREVDVMVYFCWWLRRSPQCQSILQHDMHDHTQGALHTSMNSTWHVCAACCKNDARQAYEVSRYRRLPELLIHAELCTVKHKVSCMHTCEHDLL
jgi:hypothetical protein